MEQLHDITRIIALTMGVAWASGINLYATLATLGLLGASGNLALPPDLMILQQPIVVTAAVVMYLVEFIADKAPGVDTGWDTLHTFIRIPAGALLAAGAVGELNPAVTLAAAILGGGLAAGTHLTKAGSRLLINASPEPFSNIAASVGEDTMVVGGLYLAWQQPLLFLLLLALFIGIMVWALPRLWRSIRQMLHGILEFFRGTAARGSRPAADARPDPEETLP